MIIYFNEMFQVWNYTTRYLIDEFEAHNGVVRAMDFLNYDDISDLIVIPLFFYVYCW